MCIQELLSRLHAPQYLLHFLLVHFKHIIPLRCLYRYAGGWLSLRIVPITDIVAHLPSDILKFLSRPY